MGLWGTDRSDALVPLTDPPNNDKS
jgi:hypothetical protein